MALETSPQQLRDGILATARALGIDPLDLATAISYETAGTFNPSKGGPTTKWGKHRGLIQFGEPQARKYGVDWNDPVGSQLGPNGAVAKYLREAGVKPGMGLLDIYSAINAGGVGRYAASDAKAGGAPGTVRDKVNNQMAGHRRKAGALLGNVGATPPYVPEKAPTPAQNAIASVAPQSRPGAAPMPGQGGGAASMLGGPAADTFTPTPLPEPPKPTRLRERLQREQMRRRLQEELARRGATGTAPAGHTNQFEGFDPSTVPGYNPETGMVEKSRTNSFLHGAADATTFGFGDELAAGAVTGIDRLTGRESSYNENLAGIRGNQADARADNPGAYLGGAVTGGLAQGVVTAPLAPAAAANTLGRMGQGARLGATYGGLYGFGSGEGGVGNRMTGALVGAGTGAAVGGLLPAVTGAISKGYNSLANATWRPALNALTNPAAEAGRRVGAAVTRDAGNKAAPLLNQADEASAALNNQQLLNVDRGGETTRALARSAANTDPEARAIIEKTASDRFASQGDRARSFIDRIMGGPVDDTATQEALKTAARGANRPAYQKAYQEGEKIVKTPELERLISSPAVVSAIKSAIKTGKDRATAEGFGEFNAAVRITDDGQVLFGRANQSGGTTFPNLQFWDGVKRELDDAAGAALRAGRKSEGATLSGLAKQLRDELDRIVPSYKDARRGAAAFFDADDALEAGRKFVTQNRKNSEVASALAKMKPAERDAFRIGFASELKDSIKQAGDRTNVINKIFGSEQAREKIRLALGDQNFKEFEAFVKVENAMDLLRGAMGNSTTARQLKELGLAGGTGVGAGFYSGSLTIGIVTAAATAIARKTGKALDDRVTKHVAELLLSDKPAALKKAVTLAATSQKASASLEAIQRALGAAGTEIGTKEGTDRFKGVLPRVLGQEPRKPLEITVGRPRT